MVKRLLVTGLLLGSLLVVGLLVNIGIHELGHYAVAEYYDLDPSIHFAAPNPSAGKSSLFTSTFYTSYKTADAQLNGKDAIIAFAGPAANAILALIIGAAYFIVPKTKRDFKTQVLFAMLLVPTILSVVLNLIPIPQTDGFVVLKAMTG